MKKASFMLGILLMVSMVGCSKKADSSPWGFLQSMSGTQAPKTQLSAPPVQTPTGTPTATPTSGTTTATDKQMTLDFAFGQMTGTYTGSLLNGLPSGSGKFTTTNDTDVQWTYAGNWKDGHLQGDGTTTWNDGWSESGTYTDDYLVVGESFWNTKLLYRGTYSKEKYNGQGTTYDEVGNVIFKGEFKNGYLVENEEDRITRADMIAPEDMEITKSNYKTILGDESKYIGKLVELHGKVETFWDDNDDAFTQAKANIGGNASYPVEVMYRYAVNERRMKVKNSISAFGVIVGVDTTTDNGKTYAILVMEAHVVYID